MKRCRRLMIVLIIALSGILFNQQTFGQVTISGAPLSSLNAGWGPGDGDFLFPNVTATDLSVNSLVALQLTGDWILQMPRNDSTGVVQYEAYLPLTVELIPVLVSNFQIDIHSKWVNGGGDIDNPLTSYHVTTSLNEFGSFNPHLDPLALKLETGKDLTGNGYVIAAETISSQEVYALGSLQDYYLALRVTTTIDIVDFTDLTSTVVVTNESGGDFGDAFNGIVVSFEWQPIPEPSSLALAFSGALGIGLLSLRSIKRRLGRV